MAATFIYTDESTFSSVTEDNIRNATANLYKNSSTFRKAIDYLQNGDPATYTINKIKGVRVD
jgi:hypothetical protein